EDIEGRYDGKDYVFPNDHPVDIHKAVATHIFGFMLPEESDDPRVQDKTAALLRLGWVTNSGDKKEGLKRLRTLVRFEEIPPFPTVLKLRIPEENTGLTQMDLPDKESSSAGALATDDGKGGVAGAARPADPPRKTLGLPKTGHGTK